MDATRNIETYANQMLAIVHPELCESGSQALDKLRTRKATADHAAAWTSVFSGITVVTNQRTKKHRDRNGHFPWYDLLLACGKARDAKLKIEELGVEFDYGPGTGIFLCGNLLAHEVEDWGQRERVCYAHYMRYAVLKRLGITLPGYSNQNMYKA